jgi:hypothetical protein
MKTLNDILAAARKLPPDQFVQLRQKLDQLERHLWRAELATTTKELQDAGIDDRQIDKMVVRRRRESRA